MENEIFRLQENLEVAVKERDAAIAALNLFVNDQVQSPISYVENIPTGAGHVLRTRYVQSPDNVSIEWAGVCLRVTLKQDFVELSFNGDKHNHESTTRLITWA